MYALNMTPYYWIGYQHDMFWEQDNVHNSMKSGYLNFDRLLIFRNHSNCFDNILIYFGLSKYNRNNGNVSNLWICLNNKDNGIVDRWKGEDILSFLLYQGIWCSIYSICLTWLLSNNTQWKSLTRYLLYFVHKEKRYDKTIQKLLTFLT